MLLENFIWEEKESCKTNKYLTLIIYDIVDNKRRLKMVRCLEQYGYRVQKSAFEALLDQKMFVKLRSEIPKVIDEKEDCVKIYRLKGVSETVTWGNMQEVSDDEMIFI